MLPNITNIRATTVNVIIKNCGKEMVDELARISRDIEAASKYGLFSIAFGVRPHNYNIDDLISVIEQSGYSVESTDRYVDLQHIIIISWS